MSDTEDLKVVGDLVCFKSDVEQCAEIIKIGKREDMMGRRRTVYIVKAGLDGFSGQYINGSDTYEVDAADCW